MTLQIGWRWFNGLSPTKIIKKPVLGYVMSLVVLKIGLGGKNDRTNWVWSYCFRYWPIIVGNNCIKNIETS